MKCLKGVARVTCCEAYCHCQHFPQATETPVAVTHTLNGGTPYVIRRFDTVTEAETWINRHRLKDPLGVFNGDYGIDAPEAQL